MVSILSTLYKLLHPILLQSLLPYSSFRWETPHANAARFSGKVDYIVKTANAPTSPNPRYTFKLAPVLVAAFAAFVSAVLPPLLVPVAAPAVAVALVAVTPVAVAPAAVPALEAGLGVCVGPEPLPPPQYGAQGLLSVA